MLAQEFKQKVYTEYMNSDGLVMVKNRLLAPPDQQWLGMGNALMNTGLFFTILAELGALTQADKDWLRNVIKNATVQFNGSPMHGLITRGPGKTADQQTQDDYYTMLSAAYHAEDRFAEDCFNYGEKNLWYWDNLRPTGGVPATLFDRFPGFVPYTRLCARDEISVYENPSLIGPIIAAAFSKADNADSRIHRWCQLTVYRKEELFFGGVSSDIYRWKTKRTFGSIAASFAPYYQPTDGVPHPFTLVEGLK